MKIVSNRMLFPSPKRLKIGNISKIKTIECRVTIVDDSGNNRHNVIVEVKSEVHSSLQDLSATLFRRGVRVEMDGLTVVYGPRCIAKIEMKYDPSLNESEVEYLNKHSLGYDKEKVETEVKSI